MFGRGSALACAEPPPSPTLPRVTQKIRIPWLHSWVAKAPPEKRHRCECITKSNLPCTWLTDQKIDGRWVCKAHKRAKSRRFE